MISKQKTTGHRIVFVLPIFFAWKTQLFVLLILELCFHLNRTKICSQNMKVLRYFWPVFVLYASQLLVTLVCQAETHLQDSHVKSLPRNPTSRKYGNKNALDKDLKYRNTLELKAKEDSSSVKSRKTSSISSENEERIASLGHKINAKKDGFYHVVNRSAGKLTKSSSPTHIQEGSRELKSKAVATPTNGRKPTHSKKSKLTNNSPSVKSDKTHQKNNARKKKKLFKKYALVQSFSPLQSSEDYQPIIAGGGDQGYGSLTEGDQTGEVRDQDAAQDQQQIGYTNSMSQYDSAGYQQGNSQSPDTNFASTNSEDAGQSEGGQQPSSLEQAIQLQQEAYTQQPQEQGQEGQGMDLGGQEGQAIEGGQLQYQSEQAGQEQGAQEGAQEQGGGQTGFEQAGYQQEQSQDFGEQQSQGIEQQLQQQEQPQEYQQQPQQQTEESQESEGASSESQTLATTSNSLGGLFGSEGQQTTADQQGQGTLTYASEQPNESGGKAPPPGIQYASSIEEALKEPAVTPQETNSEGGDSQGGLGTTDSANVINIGGGSDSRVENNGFIGAGTVSSPSTFQTAAIDDNGNTEQPGTGSEVNGYTSMNDQTSNGETTGFDGSQQPPSSSASEGQGTFNLAGQQFQQPGPGTKVPSLEDDFYKIINIANKNGPTAGKNTFSLSYKYIT